jgi:predicted MFS family arabinose efflux permease
MRRFQIYLLSFSTAIIYANNYYAQPLLAFWARAFHVSESNAGQVFFCSMLGQALGMIILIPLGDMLKKKMLILWTMGMTTLAVLSAAMATDITMLKGCILIAGFFSIGPQLMIPLAADLTNPKEQTFIIGMITVGMLAGVVFARLFAGSITAWFNWRAVYAFSTVFLLISFICIYRYIPESRPKFEGRYADILKSVWQLFIRYGEIRENIMISGSAFALSRMFWATVTFLLASAPFNYNTDMIGLFGMITLAGALSAPLVGKLHDGCSAGIIILIGIIILTASFLLLFFFPTNIVLILAGGALMEGSRQLIQIPNQSQTISLVPEARSRLNMLYISGCLVGASLGAGAGLMAWHWDRWRGVCYVAFAILAIQGVIFMQSWRGSRRNDKDAPVFTG